MKHFTDALFEDFLQESAGFEKLNIKSPEELGALNAESNIPYRINKKFSAEQLDNYIQQHYGSEEPATGSIYIAPNGKFINSGVDHAFLVYALETNNLLKRVRNYKSFADDDGYVFVDGEILAVLLGYVRCNTCIGDWAYISLPSRAITSAQGWSLVDWLDTHIYTNKALKSIEVNTDNSSHEYSLIEYTSEEIVQKIKRYYASGRLYESASQIDYLPVSDVELFKEYAYDILDGYGNMSDAAIKSGIKEIHFEGKLAGYIGFSEYEENGNKCLGIGNFMIIERGKGLGSAVIQNIVEKYKNQYDLIYCFVDAKNDGAIRLYKKLGKVYDEDGPNDNGEYYVTFWDNGKWELDEEFDPPYNEQQVKSNYGEETYQRLIKDPAHAWRMKTGLELIHKEPSKKELERIWANWLLMTSEQKEESDKKSIELFGKTNAENFAELIKTYS